MVSFLELIDMLGGDDAVEDDRKISVKIIRPLRWLSELRSILQKPGYLVQPPEPTLI